MSALSVSLPRAPIATDEGLTLLHDLYTVEHPPTREPRPAGWYRAELRGRVQQWLRRAALWGAGPDGAWRAW